MDIHFQSVLCPNPILHALPHQSLVQELCQTVRDGNVEFGAEESDQVEVVEEHTEKMACVKIGSEEFSIVEVPSSATTVVRKQREYLLGSIDLSVLMEDHSHLGNFVRLAYNGTAGHTELQIQIQEIGYDVTKLCDKSAVTVSMFKQASGSILNDLQRTYQFLLDGLEVIALEALALVSEVAKGMATAGEELYKNFGDESPKMEGVLKGTMKEKRYGETKMLQRLSPLMLKIALFWKQMQMHCEALARDKIQKMVMRVMKRPEKERLRVWTAKSFKTQVITYYAQWVALDDVCAIYMAKIKETQKTLYSSLTENPTLSESWANVRQLVIQFSHDLKRAHSEIDGKNAADEEERTRMLQSGSSSV